ncbi:MAG: D-glycero-beta-D-manno-heptose-7-phosphate kinase [Sphingobacteriales bacterium]|nr:MAG: D-glycero-beta-D-manno-heptose-7-phosphate kinase [Sphingobacteriales bacterium]TAF78511.1 MAG: D-glycero-beta-D-manno-heptose-7-phosphate kinase [Sphingobacteriales bacterium]
MSQLFDSFDKLNIVIIGDVMIDAYLWGKVDRISPEAPVPIVSVTKKEHRLGGAANVVLNLQALGATPFICALVGDDAEGEVFIQLLKKAKISDKGIIKIKGRPTTIKTRVIGHNQQILRIDEETEEEISSAQSQIVIQNVSCFLAEHKIDAIIFEDYDKGLITQALIDEVIKQAKQKNIPVIVDPKKRNFLSYKEVDLFKPNLKELKEGLKLDFDAHNHQQLQAAVAKLQSKISAKNVMVTLSELGVYAASDTNEKLIPAHIRTVADVSGAGDTVISVTAVCLAAGADIFTAAQIGNLAGGLVCEKVGVVPINKMQLLTEALRLES